MREKRTRYADVKGSSRCVWHSLFQQSQELGNVTRSVRLRIWVWKTERMLSQKKSGWNFPSVSLPLNSILLMGTMKTRTLNILLTSEEMERSVGTEAGESRRADAGWGVGREDKGSFWLLTPLLHEAAHSSEQAHSCSSLGQGGEQTSFHL